MKENRKIYYCDLCRYVCTPNPEGGGRKLLDLNGDPHYLKDKIEACKARIILIEDPLFPKNQARSIVQLPEKKY